MPTYQYQVAGSAAYSVDEPDLSTIPPYPSQYATDANITEVQLTAFFTALQGKRVTVTINTMNMIPDAIRSEIRKILFPQGGTPLLPDPNPIVDVVVNQSQPSGGDDIWQTTPDYSVHPLSNLSVPQGVKNVTIAPHAGIPSDPNHWVSANVVASRIY